MISTDFFPNPESIQHNAIPNPNNADDDVTDTILNPNNGISFNFSHISISG